MNTETRVESQAVSASSRPERWHAINWRKTSEAVRKLQVRIAKAAQRQEWRRVKALQRMLTRSLAAKTLAVRRVTENRGKDTPGVDGKLWSTPKTKWEAIFDMKRTGYHPKPLRRVYIPKSNGKLRPLGIPTMRDRACRRYICWRWNPCRKRQPTATVMVFVRCVQRQTLLNSAL